MYCIDQFMNTDYSKARNNSEETNLVHVFMNKNIKFKHFSNMIPFFKF